MIQLKRVSMAFRDSEVLRGIDLTIHAGETLVIIGGSGSGKSTLLRLMIGLIRPTAGEIWIDGEEITHLTERELDRVRLKMGMVFQYSALFDSMTVGDNVAFGLREHTDRREEEIARIVRDKLRIVGLEGAESKMPGELSGGMKKRVSLARAIAIAPSIVFYDEPSSGLDPLTTAKIDELIIRTQRELGVTSVVVTHDMESACKIADRIAMMHGGEIIALGTPEEFIASHDARVRAFFRGIAKAHQEVST